MGGVGVGVVFQNGSLVVHHVLGNHCLRVPADVLMGRLGMTAMYYRVDIWEGWKLLVLNSNDIGIHAEVHDISLFFSHKRRL